jgi:hypothetical protein
MWAWILSDTVARYVVPYIDRFYVVVGDMAKTIEVSGKANLYFIKTVSLLIQIIFTLCLIYIMTSFSVWCILRCVMYTQGLDENRWVYFIAGGICCELALGRVARASTYRSFLGMLPYVMAMGAFIYFPLNYEPIRTAFPWMIKFVGLSSL